MSFTALPIELLHVVSDNLPSKCVFKILRNVNRRFYAAFSDAVYWRRRFLRLRLPNKVLSRDALKVAKLCIEVEKEVLFWGYHDGGHDFIKSSKSVLNFITVDAVLFIQYNDMSVIVTASRDRSLRLFETADTTVPIVTIANAHDSWINNLMPIQLQSSKTLMLSTGFDGSLRLWKLPSSKTEFCNQHPLAKLSLKSTVVDLASSMDNDGRLFFLCADNCIRMVQLDVSTKTPILKPQGRLTYFKRQTLSIAVCTDKSTDETLLFMSSRSQWLVALECNLFTKKCATKLDSEALCVQVSASRVYCGLKSGDVIVLTPDLMLLKVVQAFSINISVTRLIPTAAHLICASANGSICVISLRDELSEEVCRGRCTSPISAISFGKNKLALALSDCSVRLFV